MNAFFPIFILSLQLRPQKVSSFCLSYIFLMYGAGVQILTPAIQIFRPFGVGKIGSKTGRGRGLSEPPFARLYWIICDKDSAAKNYIGPKNYYVRISAFSLSLLVFLFLAPNVIFRMFIKKKKQMHLNICNQPSSYKNNCKVDVKEILLNFVTHILSIKAVTNRISLSLHFCVIRFGISFDYSRQLTSQLTRGGGEKNNISVAASFALALNPLYAKLNLINSHK